MFALCTEYNSAKNATLDASAAARTAEKQWKEVYLRFTVSEQHMPPENFEMYIKNEDYMLFRVVEVIA